MGTNTRSSQEELRSVLVYKYDPIKPVQGFVPDAHILLPTISIN